MIGDIHGALNLLNKLLACLEGRQIVVVGDLCDRGPDTRGVIQRLIDVGAVGVIGNHDLWFVQWASGGELDPFAMTAVMGGRETLASYGVTPREAERRTTAPPEHAEWLSNLHLVIDLNVSGDSYWVTHAGITSHREMSGLSPAEVVPFLANNHPEDLLWPANEPSSMLPVDRPIIMGHRVQKAPFDNGHTIAIDTGARYQSGGSLTALLLPEREFVTVEG